ncbi:anaerobic glycerol-3-phosphate dehydrogenase subunit A [Salidesulfovibrio brasiliensis]
MQANVLIIGGGATGTGLARDLALRGVSCLLLEKRDLNAGASGANHGLLHSGGRYVSGDAEAAIECREEGDILKRLAPQCIEETAGLFVAVDGDDETFAADFPGNCKRCGIPCKELDPARARELEPYLSERTFAAYEVQDGSIDPFMLALDNVAHAVSLGAKTMRNARVRSFDIEKGRIRRVHVTDETENREFIVEPELVVNAAGAWAGEIATMAGAQVGVICSKGTLLVTQDRLSTRVINRLRKPSDGDILVPGGTVSVLGTTSVRVPSPEDATPTREECVRQVEDAAKMMPVLASTRYIRAYAGIRPLISLGGSDDRNVSRGFSLVNHDHEGIDNFITISGGKLTTYRLMAEKAADLVCEKLGENTPCRTREEPLPASVSGRWTEPGLAPRNFAAETGRTDVMLCECELISRSVIEEITRNLENMRGRSALNAIGMRSRMGKGPCQGAFCGPRVTSYLYDREVLSGTRGIEELKSFIQRRWKGQKPIMWGRTAEQVELQEALHCALLELELTGEDE